MNDFIILRLYLAQGASKLVMKFTAYWLIGRKFQRHRVDDMLNSELGQGGLLLCLNLSKDIPVLTAHAD